MTGFRESEGKIILFLDADLQYNANDIPLFLKKIDEGFDVVNGWRVERKDGLSRIIPSKAYNLLTNLILGPSLHDHNCGMKAFKKGVVEYILLRTDQHRYITSLAHKLGYRVCEVRIHHNPRMHGKPKFNSPVRFFTGLIDLIAVQFQLSYLYKPLLFFVPLGLSLLSIGAISSFYILYLYLTVDFPGGILKYHLPLIVLTSLVILFGLVVIVFSLLAEMVSIIKRDVDFIKEQLRK
jgi:dolichol-phosphate mannosyltransferase